MSEARIAVKAFIIKDNQVLLLKRRSTDVHKPGEWDIPGGRLDVGEDPFLGLKREVQEEAGIDIEIKMPLDVHHFTRDDGQTITMLIFWCIPLAENIVLSEEHTEYMWQDITKSIDSFPKWLEPVIQNYISINA